MLSIIYEAGFKLLVVFNRDFISLFMHIDIKVLIMIKKNIFIVKMVFDFRHTLTIQYKIYFTNDLIKK